jgi:hypothetical protein
MTTIVIDDKKRGAKQMLDLLKELDFVSCVENVSKNNSALLRRQKLIQHPRIYNPLALAGVAENQPLNLTEIRKEWRKGK